MDPATLVVILTFASGEERIKSYPMHSVNYCLQYAIALRRNAAQKGQAIKVECRYGVKSDGLPMQIPNS